MTAKRFTITQDFEEHHRQIRDNGKIIMGCFLEPQAEPIVKLLNELHEENEQLQSDLQYWRTLVKSLAKGNNIGGFEMMDEEVTVDLNELDINIQKEIIFKSDLNKWIEKKMDYYEGMMEKTDGSNYVNANGHLDMLIVLKEWIKQR